MVEKDLKGVIDRVRFHLMDSLEDGLPFPSPYPCCSPVEGSLIWFAVRLAKTRISQHSRPAGGRFVLLIVLQLVDTLWMVFKGLSQEPLLGLVADGLGYLFKE